MIGIHFVDLEAFLQELERHATDPRTRIQRRTVRATSIERQQVINGPKHIHVVASFVSIPQPRPLGHVERDELIHLQAACGSLWIDEDDNQKTLDRWDSTMAAIEAVTERHELQLHSGLYELSTH